MRKQNKLEIIPLGGLGEVGKNMTVIRYGSDIVVLGCGMAFPVADRLGIDLVIPVMTYLGENQDKIRAVVITHGHEDHIGALSYFLQQFQVPVYGTRLAMGLAEGRLKENRVDRSCLNIIEPGDELVFGKIRVGFVQTSHSIPDAVALYFKTPMGTIVHTGDFKVDYTPVDGKKLDFQKFAKLGEEGVLALMADSTNAETPGFTKSESTVMTALDKAFDGARGRILLATFASNVWRIQQAVDAACIHGRRVVVVGRSMVNVINIAMDLGYLKIPEAKLIDVDEMRRYPAAQLLILTTGSQGEPMAGLSRMSRGDHRKIQIERGDRVIFSATPIPGNENAVSKTIDSLLRLGADGVHERSAGIHVSGHACQEDLRLELSLIRPKYLIPVHGEYRMLMSHRDLAEEWGLARENILIGENGQVFQFNRENGEVKGAIAGNVTSGKVYIDGLGVGDVGNIVLRDRQMLSQDGVMIVVIVMEKGSSHVVAGPDMVSRGFIYVREAGELMESAKKVVCQALDKCEEKDVKEWSVIKSSVRDALGKFIYAKTRRRPIILTIIQEL